MPLGQAAGEPIEDNLSILRQAPEALDRKYFRTAPEILRDLDNAFAIGPCIPVFAVKCARDNSDHRGRPARKVFCRFNAQPEASVFRDSEEAVVKQCRRELE